MTSLRIARFALLLLASWLTCGHAVAQEDPPAPAPTEGAEKPAAVVWEAGTSDEILARAAREKKLVLWVLMMDGEKACDRMLAQVFKDKEVIRLIGEHFLTMPCHSRTNASIGDEGVEGACPKFAGTTWAQVFEHEKRFQTDYETAQRTIAPQHLVTTGGGHVVLRKAFEMKAPEMREFLRNALELQGISVAAAPKPAEEGAEGEAAPGPAAEGEATALNAVEERLLRLVREGPEEERPKEAQNLAQSGRPVALEALFTLLAGREIKKQESRFDIVRALGGEEYAASAPYCAAQLLATTDKKIRHAAVVTLEEMKDVRAAAPLLELLETERDRAIRYDILRALGPTGVGNEEALKALLKAFNGRDAQGRVAAAMALGHHLSGNEEVREALRERYVRESKGLVPTAIAFAYNQAKDPAVSDDLRKLKERERNREKADILEVILAGLEEREPDIASGGGRGGRGPRRPEWFLMQAFRPLFEKDEIERNFIKNFRRFLR